MNYETLAGLNSPDYLQINTEQGISLGGSQMWWKERSACSAARGISAFRNFRQDAAYRMWQYGCGVVALCDLQLYLDKRRARSAIMSKPEYMSYVDDLQCKRYRLTRGVTDFLIGLKPWRMTKGLRRYLNQGGKNEYPTQEVIVRWAPFMGFGRASRREKLLEDICEMLKQDIPVVCAYHCFFGEGLGLYECMEDTLDAKVDSSAGKPVPVARVKSHYMTVVEVLAWQGGEDPGRSRRSEADVVIKVISWGRAYYVSFAEYAKYINLFTNVLRIKG